MIFILKNYSTTKQILRYIKLIIPSQASSLMPPIGPTLAQFGLNVNDFSNNFNEYTNENSFYSEQLNLKILIILYIDKSYDFIILGVNIASLINEIFVKYDDYELKIKKISLLNLTKILFIQQNFSFLHSRALLKSIISTLYSMHIKISMTSKFYLNYQRQNQN